MEIVAPQMNALDTVTAVAACQTVFDDPRILWRVVNYNSGTSEMNIMGLVADSENKVVVSTNSRSAVAFYQDRVGQTILASRSLQTVGAACSDLKLRISSDNNPFIN